MSFADLFFPVTTIALSVALWSCWRSGKPAREAKRLKAEQDHRDAVAEAKRIAEAQFTADVISVLDDIVRGRIDAEKQMYTHHGRDTVKYPSVKLLQDMKGDRAVIERILGRADRTHERITELSQQVCEVNSVLRMYHPRNSPANEFPTIRKG